MELVNFFVELNQKSKFKRIYIFEGEVLQVVEHEAGVNQFVVTISDSSYFSDTRVDGRKIEFTGQKQGQMVFDYLNDIDDITKGFTAPRTNSLSKPMWLFEVINKN